MSMADDAPPAMPRSEPFGMMHEHEPDPTYAAEPTMPCCAECVNKPEDTCAV